MVFNKEKDLPRVKRLIRKSDPSPADTNPMVNWIDWVSDNIKDGGSGSSKFAGYNSNTSTPREVFIEPPVDGGIIQMYLQRADSHKSEFTAIRTNWHNKITSYTRLVVSKNTSDNNYFFIRLTAHNVSIPSYIQYASNYLETFHGSGLYEFRLRIPENITSLTLDYFWTKTYPGEGSPTELFIISLTSLITKDQPGSGGGEYAS